MASISSTNSTSSLGNTSLRGFGGMVSGIDRDSIVEQMTLGTTTKINNQKKAMTQLQWKQEAYRGVSDKIIDWADKYASYSSSSNLKDAMVFAKNQVTVHGSENSTKFVTATGTSSLIQNVSLKGVEQLASSAVQRSQAHVNNSGLQTNLKSLSDVFKFSKLEGAQISFAVYNTQEKAFDKTVTFTFPSTYTDETDGKTKSIDYNTDNLSELVEQMNLALKQSDKKLGDKSLSDCIKFTLVGTGDDKKIQITKADGTSFTETDNTINNFVIRGGSALSALGYVSGEKKEDGSHYADDGINLYEFNENVKESFKKTYRSTDTALNYMTGAKLTFNLNGSEKSIELITADEKAAIEKETDPTKQIEMLQANLQKRLNMAYGTDKIEVTYSDDQGLGFKTVEDGAEGDTLSIKANDTALLKNLGLEYGSSNKVNLDGKLSQGAFGDVFRDQTGELDLVINGVQIKGLTANSSINDILSKINSTTEAGVKATYVEATGQFMLVTSETGAGRQIALGKTVDGNIVEKAGDGLAQKLFGSTNPSDFVKGQDAIIHVSYGNGMDVTLNRSSNTFNLEGLNVTVTGEFGGTKDATGTWTADPSQTITFTAKADVDGVTEKVKSFFEDFNALVTEISSQVRTRPDSSYGPLTDEQKAQMDETSIENWEKKAKQGLLYGDSAMRDLSADVETIFTKLMMNGASYEDLKEIGITYSEDYLDGGTLVFDESKFREAMESDPDKVANIFTGGGGVSKGLVNVIDETFTPYATRYASKNGNSYGRLIEIAGSEKKPTSLMDNEIYKQLKEMEETIASLQDRLKVEQDRYISQFTTMESLINQMNTQQSYLSQITG